MDRLTIKDFEPTSELMKCMGGTVLLGMYEKLAHYEDLEESGRLVVLPCKVGETVYYIIYENCLDGKCIWFDDDGGCRKGGISSDYCPQKVAQMEFRLGDIDKNIFLTREEAEAALKGGGQDE